MANYELSACGTYRDGVRIGEPNIAFTYALGPNAHLRCLCERCQANQHAEVIDVPFVVKGERSGELLALMEARSNDHGGTQ